MTSKNSYSKIANDGWRGIIDGVTREFTVIGVCGNDPVIRFNDSGIQGILNWNKGELI